MDPKLLADEVRRVARKGCHAISFADNPTKLGHPSLHNDHWDPFWKACTDEGTVVAIHIGSSSGMVLQDMEAPVEIMITSTPISLFQCATEIVFSKFLRKYPGLKIALSEGGIGWVPYFLERADYVYEHHRYWTHQDFGDRKPSDVFREHVIACFIDDAAGIEQRARIGLDTITWECDYPHSDTTWPDAPERLWRSLGSVPDDEIHAITHRNAMRHFQFEPFSRRPAERCTVAALRAEAADVDTRPRSAGGKPPSEDATAVVTIGDIAQQLAGAFAVPVLDD